MNLETTRENIVKNVFRLVDILIDGYGFTEKEAKERILS